MFYSNVDADSKPSKVLVEELPDKKRVCMADSIEEYTPEASEEATADRTIYRYDEVVFDLPQDSEVTAAQIEEEFESWWKYGQSDEQPEAEAETETGAEDSDLEQQVTDLQLALCELYELLS